MSLQLEVGKTFLTREGNRCKIIEDNRNKPYNFYKFKGLVKLNAEVTFSYSIEGKLFEDADSPNDLVSETTPEVIVGQTYVTKGGYLVKIVNDTDSRGQYNFAGVINGSDWFSYNDKGKAEGCYTESYDLYKFVVETKEANEVKVKEETMKTIKPNSWYITKENTLLKVESQSTLDPDMIHCYGDDHYYAVDDLVHEVTEEVNAIFEKYKPKLEIEVGNYYLHENGEVVKVDWIDWKRSIVQNTTGTEFSIEYLTKDVTEQIKCLL